MWFICEQNQKRLKLMLAAFEKHNMLMAEAQDNCGNVIHIVAVFILCTVAVGP